MFKTLRCAHCGVFAKSDDLVIDHVLPRSHPDYNKMANLRLVHPACQPKKPNVFKRFWRWIMDGRA